MPITKKTSNGGQIIMGYVLLSYRQLSLKANVLYIVNCQNSNRFFFCYLQFLGEHGNDVARVCCEYCSDWVFFHSLLINCLTNENRFWVFIFHINRNDRLRDSPNERASIFRWFFNASVVTWPALKNLFQPPFDMFSISFLMLVFLHFCVPWRIFFCFFISFNFFCWPQRIMTAGIYRGIPRHCKGNKVEGSFASRPHHVDPSTSSKRGLACELHGFFILLNAFWVLVSI